jgi:hypothetical protein
MLRVNAKMIATLFVAAATLSVSSAKAIVNSTSEYDGRDRRVRDMLIDLPFLENLKTRNQLKDDFRMVLQECIGDFFEVDGQWISFQAKDIVGIDVFEKGAEFYMNGIQLSTLPDPMVYMSKDDPSVMIVKGHGGRLLRATKRDPISGKTVSIVPVEPGSDSCIFITVSEVDIHDGMMQNFTYGDTELLNPEELSDGERVVGAPAQPMFRGGHKRHRWLSSPCTSYNVIELVVVFDSSFCAYHGSAVNAIAEVQAIVAATSMRYEQEGLCVQVRLTQVDGYCVPSEDPFVEVFETADGVCGNHAER